MGSKYNPAINMIHEKASIEHHVEFEGNLLPPLAPNFVNDDSPRNTSRMKQAASRSCLSGKTGQVKCQRASYIGRKVPSTSAKRWGLALTRRTDSANMQISTERGSRLRVSSNPSPIPSEELLSTDSDDDSFVPENDMATVDSDRGLLNIELVDETGVEDDQDDFQMHDRIDSEEKASAWADDDDSYVGIIYRNGILFEDTDGGPIKLEPWLIFTHKEHLMEVLTDYCIQEGFAILSLKSDQKRVTVECAAEGCGWRLHASQLPDGITWAIKTNTGVEHTCARLQEYNPMATTKWAAKQLLEDVRANPELPPKALNNILFERFGICLRGTSMYKMKDIAIQMVDGGHDASYALLPAYCEMVRNTIPGSHAFCVWRESEVVAPERPLLFNNLFIALHACVEGVIRGVRPLIGVDGTHLKGNYGGVLLYSFAIVVLVE